MLSPRIAAAFTDRVDIYVPLARAVDSDRFSTGEARFGAATYADVRCRLDSKYEISEALPHGRSNVMNMDTSDQLRVLASQPLQDGWYVKLTTDGHPLENQWFIVQGDAKTLNWRAGVKVHILKRATKPPGVA